MISTPNRPAINGGMDGVFKVPLPRRPQNVFRHTPNAIAFANLQGKMNQTQQIQRVLEAKAAY